QPIWRRTSTETFSCTSSLASRSSARKTCWASTTASCGATLALVRAGDEQRCVRRGSAGRDRLLPDVQACAPGVGKPPDGASCGSDQPKYTSASTSCPCRIVRISVLRKPLPLLLCPS